MRKIFTFYVLRITHYMVRQANVGFEIVSASDANVIYGTNILTHLEALLA